MKKYYILLLLFLTSCGGTTGHIQFYNFSVPELDLQTELKRVITEDKKFTAPNSWNGYQEGFKKNDIFIYFKTGPRELFFVGFKESPELNNKGKSTLALVGVFNGSEWRFAQDLSSDEEKMISQRFEKEILSKMKFRFEKE